MQGSFSRCVILFPIEGPVGGWHYITLAFQHISEHMFCLPSADGNLGETGCCWDTPPHLLLCAEEGQAPRGSQKCLCIPRVRVYFCPCKTLKMKEKWNLDSLGLLPNLVWFCRPPERSVISKVLARRHTLKREEAHSPALPCGCFHLSRN